MGASQSTTSKSSSAQTLPVSATHEIYTPVHPTSRRYISPNPGHPSRKALKRSSTLQGAIPAELLAIPTTSDGYRPKSSRAASMFNGSSSRASSRSRQSSRPGSSMSSVSSSGESFDLPIAVGGERSRSAHSTSRSTSSSRSSSRDGESGAPVCNSRVAVLRRGRY